MGAWLGEGTGWLTGGRRATWARAAAAAVAGGVRVGARMHRRNVYARAEPEVN